MKIVLLDRESIGYDTPISLLDKFGDVAVYNKSTPEEAISRSKDADIIIINKIKITRQLMENALNLKLVCVFATGYDNIDVAAARELKIGVCNVPAYSTDSVVLFTVATTLALCSHLYEYTSFVKSGEYSVSGTPNRLVPVYHEIRGKTWGVIGYGNIGRGVAKVAEALGAKVIVYKRTPVSGVECVDINTLCSESDIITIHCPLNEESKRLISKERIALMKPSTILVNEARGAVLDEQAVADAIEMNLIGAFGCDVYSTEPFSKNHPYNKIKHLKNVLFTPHAAWGSYESRVRCIEIICNNISSFISGEMLNRVDNLWQK